MELQTILIGLGLLLSQIQTDLDLLKNKEEMTFNKLPIELQHITLCESGGKPTVRGPFGEIGLLQIHPLHVPVAKKMGLNLYDPNDNMKFALHLYKKNGLRDWEASKSCWTKKLALHS